MVGHDPTDTWLDLILLAHTDTSGHIKTLPETSRSPCVFCTAAFCTDTFVVDVLLLLLSDAWIAINFADVRTLGETPTQPHFSHFTSGVWLISSHTPTHNPSHLVGYPCLELLYFSHGIP